MTNYQCAKHNWFAPHGPCPTCAMQDAVDTLAYPRTTPELAEPEPENVEGYGPPITARDTQVGGRHYKVMKVQPWDVVDTWPHEQQIGYYRGGALKYIMRMGSKDESPAEIAKGKHYLEKLLEVLNG